MTRLTSPPAGKGAARLPSALGPVAGGRQARWGRGPQTAISMH
jgi:hypothetical protein